MFDWGKASASSAPYFSGLLVASVEILLWANDIL